MSNFTYQNVKVANPIDPAIWEAIIDNLKEAIMAEGYRIGDACGPEDKIDGRVCDWPFFTINQETGEVCWFREERDFDNPLIFVDGYNLLSYEGKDYLQTREVFPSDMPFYEGGTRYEATAEDGAGNTYWIRWDFTAEQVEAAGEDEGELPWNLNYEVLPR